MLGRAAAAAEAINRRPHLEEVVGLAGVGNQVPRGKLTQESRHLILEQQGLLARQGPLFLALLRPGAEKSLIAQAPPALAPHQEPIVHAARALLEGKDGGGLGSRPEDNPDQGHHQEHQQNLGPLQTPHPWPAHPFTILPCCPVLREKGPGGFSRAGPRPREEPSRQAPWGPPPGGLRGPPPPGRSPAGAPAPPVADRGAAPAWPGSPRAPGGRPDPGRPGKPKAPRRAESSPAGRSKR